MEKIEDVKLKSQKVTIRLTDEEKEKMKEIIEEGTVSDHIRSVIFNRRKIEYRYRYSSEYEAAANNMKAKLKNISTNLNQIAIVTNRQKDNVSDNLLKLLISEITKEKENIEELQDDIQTILKILRAGGEKDVFSE